jgi:eukaryotic-like serine/threonine-protein kinase
MNRERWLQVDRISASALGRSPDERAAFLDEECNGDAEMRREVESLIAHGQAGSFMERPAAEEAALLFAKATVDPLPGQTIGQYKILRRLGAGGMGEIYIARDARLDRSVALKLLLTRFAADEERVGRFRQEALAASALNHPNILTVYEIGEWENRDFIAAEYIEGVTLRKRMRGRGLSLVAAVDIALQIASAMAAAHDAGIVHRDIKPENIMLRPDGLVKVLDFGIAKYAEPTGARDVKGEWIKTATGVVIGTIDYMSPEQARGDKVDARTDIWSLGVILYEIIARRVPFPGRTSMDRIAAILEREPEPLGKLRHGVPEDFGRIINRALVKDRDGRYARASDLVDDLRRFRATLGENRSFRFVLPEPMRWLFFSRKQMSVALAALLAVSAAVAAGLYHFRPMAGGEAIDSIAVLPLVNAGGSADTEYLSDGITDSLIDNLSQLPSLKVMSRSSVFRYKGQEVDAKTVGNTLRVQAVLTGRVVQRGDNLSLNMELVDARDSRHLWGQEYNRKMTDLVSLQSQIARDVSRKLRARLSSADEQLLAKTHTENSEANQFYLKGRYHLLKHTRSEIQTGASHFQQAIDVDPSYALAYAGLADAYRALALPGEMPTTEALPQAKAAAQKALEIDDALAEAHAILGYIIFWYDWKWDEAEIQFKRALELDPNSADAHHNYADLLSYTGRHTEALTEIKRARELDPLNLRTSAVEGSTLINAGRADEALARLQQTLVLDPNFWFAHMFASSAYIEKGMFAEAVAEARKARKLSEISTRPTAFLGYALAKSGRRAEAWAELDGLLKLSKKRYVSSYNIAMVYNGLGKRDETLEWLERSYRERELRMVFLKGEPKWKNLRDDSRFRDLIRRIGLPQ